MVRRSSPAGTARSTASPAPGTCVRRGRPRARPCGETPRGPRATVTRDPQTRIGCNSEMWLDYGPDPPARPAERAVGAGAHGATGKQLEDPERGRTGARVYPSVDAGTSAAAAQSGAQTSEGPAPRRPGTGRAACVRGAGGPDSETAAAGGETWFVSSRPLGARQLPRGRTEAALSRAVQGTWCLGYLFGGE